MSLIPTFEIGLWNAWIFTLGYMLLLVLTTRMNKDAFDKSDVKAPHEKTGKKALNLYIGSSILLLIYSIFLPLQLGTVWFYSGLAIFLLGLSIGLVIVVTWATTPLNEPITKGLYRYSRHPMYLHLFIAFIGVGIATASWLFILITIIRTVSSIMLMTTEERYCIEKYGDSYSEYMKRTPKLIGIPKS